MKKLFRGVFVSFLLFSGLTAKAQLKITSIEAATSVTTAGNGWGGNLFGMDMSLRMRVHYTALPDGLDFSVGLHERRNHWESGVGSMWFHYGSQTYTVEKIVAFEEADGFFDKDAMSRFLISVGASYTKPLGKYWGWTSDLHLLFSPIPKTKVHYNTYTIVDNQYVLQSEDYTKVNNGFTPGLGVKSSIWWKMPIKSRYDYRLGLSLGYEYLNLLYPHRHLELDGFKPLSSLATRLNHVGHIGVNFAVGLN